MEQKQYPHGFSRIWYNKTSGPDKVFPEMVKFDKKIVYQKIAEILQQISTGIQKPEMLCQHNLKPPPKSPYKEVNVNTRSKILLSFLRKIISNCMSSRCWT